MLIGTFINAIFLYDDKLVITFNYKEGAKTITFFDLQNVMKHKSGSDLDCSAAPIFSRPHTGSGEFFVTATLVNQTFTFVDSI